MKKFVFSQMVLYVILTFSSNVSAEQFSGWYEYNNNNYAGVMYLDVNGNSVSGTVYILTNPVTGSSNSVASWKLVNGTATYGADWYGKPQIKVSFQKENDNQVFHGWVSWDRNVISGYFENQYEFPWFAKKLLQ